MNLNKVLTKDYENIANWALSENKANTNPICHGVAPAASPPRRGEAGSNPISKGALHYRVNAGILTPDTLSGVVEQRLSTLGQPENNISTKH